MTSSGEHDSAVVPVITLDGPSGSGKGTVSQRLASELGWHFLDSGALYRLLACAALEQGVALDDPVGLVELANRINAEFRLSSAGQECVLLDGRDVTGELRTETTGNAASRIAAIPAVREALLAWQRRYRQSPGLIADGRDMGTVVFPDAEVKIFLTASAGKRALRRYNQLKEKGIDVSLESVVKEVEARDQRDTSRKTAPLIPAADAFVIDNGDLDIETTVAMVLDKARSIL